MMLSSARAGAACLCAEVPAGPPGIVCIVHTHHLMKQQYTEQGLAREMPYLAELSQAIVGTLTKRLCSSCPVPCALVAPVFIDWMGLAAGSWVAWCSRAWVASMVARGGIHSFIQAKPCFGSEN